MRPAPVPDMDFRGRIDYDDKPTEMKTLPFLSMKKRLYQFPHKQISKNGSVSIFLLFIVFVMFL